MGLLSMIEGKMEDAFEGPSGKTPISPVQIAKKAEKQMRREKMVGAGKQYAPTLYTVLVNSDDDQRLFGYYPTLAGETETYLSAKASEEGLVMDGMPLVRFIVDEGLKQGKFEVIAETVAAPIVAQLRNEEMYRYGLASDAEAKPASQPHYQEQRKPVAVPSEQPAQPQVAVSPESDPYAPSNNYDMFPQEGFGREAVPVTQDFRRSKSAAEANNASGVPAMAGLELINVKENTMFSSPGTFFSIGRGSTNTINVPDVSASRNHAELRLDANGSWVVTDLGSTNGTMVNGRQISTCVLNPGDVLVIGKTELQFKPLH